MASLNKVILIGNLGRDPESRELSNGMATNFSIATSRKYRNASGETVEETEWHNVAIFGKLAEIAAKYMKKGSSVYVEGRIRSRKYQAKDGTEKTAYEIIGESFQFLGGRGDGEETAAPKPAPKKAARPSKVDDLEGDDVPF